MPSKPTASEGCGYVITEQGRLDLYAGDLCRCNPRLAGLLVECPECGTVYGSLRERLSDTQLYRGKRD